MNSKNKDKTKFNDALVSLRINSRDYTIIKSTKIQRNFAKKFYAIVLIIQVKLVNFNINYINNRRPRS